LAHGTEIESVREKGKEGERKGREGSDKEKGKRKGKEGEGMREKKESVGERGKGRQ